MSQTKWHFQLLGHFALSSCSSDVPPVAVEQIRGRKARLLLIYLALYPHPHSRPNLCRILWQEKEKRTALSVELTCLRKIFGNEAGAYAFVTVQDTLALHPTWIHTDVAEFEGLLTQAEHEPNASTALKLRLEALRLYETSGPLLPEGYVEDWISRKRDELAARYQSACYQCIAELEQQGKADAALSLVHALQAFAPHNADVQALLTRLSPHGASRVSTRPSPRPATPAPCAPTQSQMAAYQTLSASERAVFGALCLFAGPFSFAALLAIGNARRKTARHTREAHLLATLQTLVQAGLLQETVQPSGSFYQVAEPLLTLGQSTLPARTRADLLRRQAAHYCALIQKVVTVAETPAHVLWQQQIEAEYANVRQTLTFYSRHPNAHLHAELIVSLAPFWQDRGWYPEAAHWYRQAHRRRREMPANVRRELLRVRGSLAVLRGRMALALCCYRKAQHGCTSPDARQQLAQSFQDLGNIAHHRGQDQQARRAYEESLALFATLNLPIQEASALAALGDTLLLAEGDVEGAHSHYERAYALREKMELLTHRADIRYRLSEIYRIRGDYSRAVSLLDEALHLFGQRAEHNGEAQCLARLGTLLMEQARVGMGRRMLEDSLTFYVQTKDTFGQAAVQGRIAEIHLRQGELDRARTLLEQGKQFWQAARHVRWKANFNARLARLACYQGRFEDALLLAEQSLAGYKHAPAPLGLAYAHFCRAHALCGLQQSESATDALAECLKIWSRTGYRKGMVEGLELAAHLALQKRDWQTGAKRLARAGTLRIQMGVPLPPAEEETHVQMQNYIRAHKNWKAAWTAGEQADTTALLIPCCANVPRPPTGSL